MRWAQDDLWEILSNEVGPGGGEKDGARGCTGGAGVGLGNVMSVGGDSGKKMLNGLSAAGKLDVAGSLTSVEDLVFEVVTTGQLRSDRQHQTLKGGVQRVLPLWRGVTAVSPPGRHGRSDVDDTPTVDFGVGKFL